MKTDKRKQDETTHYGQLNQKYIKLKEESSYFGRAYFDLNFGENSGKYFKSDCFKMPRQETVEKFQKHVTPSLITSLLEKSRKYEITQIFKNNKKNAPHSSQQTEEEIDSEIISNFNKSDWWTIGIHDLSKRLQNIDLIQLEHEAGKMGYRTIWYRNYYGLLDFYLTDAENIEINPKLFLIESYRITTFPLNYLAGKTIKTVSLAPSEKTKIFITNNKDNERNSGSCILDSNTAESSHEFQNCLTSENYNWESYLAAIEFQFNTEVDPLLFAASVKTNSSLQFNLSRNEFIKNTWKAITKHVSRASSKREILINSETNFNNDNEKYILREISNPNPGSSVNYNFRQLNQEFLTVIHLTDIRLGYTNGIITQEYPLHLMDNLLDNYFVPEKHNEISKEVINAIMGICDYKNETILDKGAIQEMSSEGKKIYYFNSHCQTGYTEITDFEIKTNGVILSVHNYILPTESLTIEAQLGNDDIQDIHIREMQGEELREKRLNNDMREREVEKLNLAASIVKDTTPEKARLFDEVFNRYDNHDK